ncbi:MAG: hypothetical protein H7249_05590 [Chitinophagaceae bacterium]|nr:hypothetical protein [Oligoflexus sp.]
MNQQYSALHGHVPMLGLSLLELTPSAESSDFLEKLKNIVETGAPFIANEISRQIFREDAGLSEESIFNFVYDPVFDTRGIVIEILVFCFDVTELVKARREIEDREKRFRILSETLPQIIWLTDADGKTRYLNPQWYAYTGLIEGDPSAGNWLLTAMKSFKP